MPPSLLAFSGVGKRFPDGTVALSGVDLSVAPGEFVSILGPSGCGKSTLLRVAAGLSQASDGTARVGTDKIGYVFQDPTLTPRPSMFEGDTYRSSARGLWPSGRQVNRVVGSAPLSHPWVSLVGVEWPGRCVDTRSRPSCSGPEHAEPTDGAAPTAAKAGRWSPLIAPTRPRSRPGACQPGGAIPAGRSGTWPWSSVGTSTATAA